MVNAKESLNNQAGDVAPCQSYYPRDKHIVGSKFIAAETGLHIRQVQRLAKKGEIPNTQKFGKYYGWEYSDIKSYIDDAKNKDVKKNQLNASNDPAY